VASPERPLSDPIFFPVENDIMRCIRGLAALTALIALSATPALAQFGIRGGMDLTRFVGSDAHNIESKAGLRMGGSYQLFTIGPIAIVPEFYYAQKGARQKESEPGVPLPVTLDFSLDYLEVPLLAKLYVPLAGVPQLRPYIAAGPAFAWNLSCEVKMDGGDLASQVQDCRGEQFRSAGTAFRSADRGVVVSGGLDLRVLGFGAVNLDARFIQGLARLSEGSGEGTDIRNQSFSLTLGYSFGL
jgi:hypothetical protein